MKMPFAPPSSAVPVRAFDPVTDEHPAHAEAGVAAERAVDAPPRTPRLAVNLGAPEQVRGLDPDDHGQLAGSDHAARLGRAVDEPEPPAPRTAVLGVDVVLHGA